MRIIFILLLAGFSISSCAPAYVPNTRNTPVFTDAHQFSGTVSGGTAALDVQTAYSFSKHVAGMINLNYMARHDALEVNGNKFAHLQTFGEAGVGYFGVLGEARLELFGGYGHGKVTSYESFLLNSETSIVRGNFDRYFLQPSFAVGGEGVTFIVTARWSWVHFRKYQTEEFGSGVVEDRPTGRYQVFAEPSLACRFRFVPKFYGFVQVGFNGAIRDSYYDANVAHVSLGLQIRTGPNDD